MYRSVIRDERFLVLITDGIFDETLFELPSEKLADRIAYELQNAWDSGVTWGSCKIQRELNTDEWDKENKQAVLKIKSNLEVEKRRSQKRYERIKMVEDARRWKKVLSWKK